MPNQTLYDNFSQVRQYIDQEKPDLSSYVTKTELSNCSYVTSSDLPVIDESIVPKENNTYTLGDNSHIYSTSYITNMWLNGTNKFSNRNSNQVNIMLNNAWRYVFHINNFSPAHDNAISLGESSARWKSTYTTNLYADNIHNLIWTGTSTEYAALSDYTTYQLYLIKNE